MSKFRIRILKVIAAVLTLPIAVFSLCVPSSDANAANIMGDVNNDGTLTNDDADAIFDYITGNVNAFANQFLDLADIDKDGFITIADVAQLYNIINNSATSVNSVHHISITSYPEKQLYYIGELFDPTGLEVAAVYSDGTVMPVTDYTCTGYSADEGVKIITVTYGKLKKSFTVEVIPSDIEYIEIITPPKTVEYLQTDAFSAEGLTVAAKYTNGTKAFISGYALSGFDSELGKKEIKVLYGTAETSFFVDVVEHYTEASSNAVATSALNCRATASSSGTILGVFAKGAKIKVLSVSGGWYYVTGTATNGQVITGYCAKQYITLTE